MQLKPHIYPHREIESLVKHINIALTQLTVNDASEAVLPPRRSQHLDKLTLIQAFLLKEKQNRGKYVLK